MLQFIVTFLLGDKNDTWRSYLQIPKIAGGNLNFFSGTEHFPYIKNVLQCESMWKPRFKRNHFRFHGFEVAKGLYDCEACCWGGLQCKNHSTSLLLSQEMAFQSRTVRTPLTQKMFIPSADELLAGGVGTGRLPSCALWERLVWM